jgi:toxin YoeB
VSELITEIEKKPDKGRGHAERLKGYKIPPFSRRIDKKNRLVFSLPPHENAIEILSMLGHYEDT